MYSETLFRSPQGKISSEIGLFREFSRYYFVLGCIHIRSTYAPHTLYIRSTYALPLNYLLSSPEYDKIVKSLRETLFHSPRGKILPL